VFQARWDTIQVILYLIHIAIDSPDEQNPASLELATKLRALLQTWEWQEVTHDYNATHCNWSVRRLVREIEEIDMVNGPRLRRSDENYTEEEKRLLEHVRTVLKMRLCPILDVPEHKQHFI